jgi:hypothetical protein
MRAGFFKGVVLGAVVASTMMVATAAVAGTGVGAVFNLGQTNKVNGTTNLSDVGNSPPLGLTAASGQPPLQTNSEVRVANLNADKLDNLDSTEFVQGFGKIRSARQHLPGTTTGATSILVVPGVVDVSATCGNGAWILEIENVTSPGQPLDVYFSGVGPAGYALLNPGFSTPLAVSGNPGIETVQIGRVGHVVTITTAAHQNGYCEFTSQAVQQ